MKYFRLNVLAIMVIFCFGATMLGLSGCGVREEKKVSPRAAEEAKEEARPEPSTKPITEERTFYDFEGELGGWEVPMWALGKSDYVAKDVEISEDVASKGNSSMKMDTDFPGGAWTAGLVEIQQYLNMSRYRVISADLYLPKNAPIGLKVKLILTVGNNWKFVEMSRSAPLIPGEWVTITANIEPGSYDWKRTVPDESFRADVRMIVVRIESNRRPVYEGPVYIDNIKIGK